MEKALTLGGVTRTFKCTGSTPLLYRTMYGTDFFKDIAKLEADLIAEDAVIDAQIIYQLAHVLAFQYDKENTPKELFDFLDEYDEGFPLFDVVQGIRDLLMVNLRSAVSKKKVAE